MGENRLLIDLSFLDAMNADEKLKKDVIGIFLTNTPPEVQKLHDLVLAKADWDVIYKQAHYLKSGFSVVKIANINDLLTQIQTLSRKEEEREMIEQLTADLITTFNMALPLLHEMGGENP